MDPVRKAVIPAAGLGTRFLPATKAQPKEMLPVVDKPAIQYVVEEAVRSGIDDILIITGRNKHSLEDHFDRRLELEHELDAKGKHELLEDVLPIPEELRAGLLSWARQHTLIRPELSPAELDWLGFELSRELARTLGELYSVEYSAAWAVPTGRSCVPERPRSQCPTGR